MHALQIFTKPYQVDILVANDGSVDMTLEVKGKSFNTPKRYTNKAKTKAKAKAGDESTFNRDAFLSRIGTYD